MFTKATQLASSRAGFKGEYSWRLDLTQTTKDNHQTKLQWKNCNNKSHHKGKRLMTTKFLTNPLRLFFLSTTNLSQTAVNAVNILLLLLFVIFVLQKRFSTVRGGCVFFNFRVLKSREVGWNCWGKKMNKCVFEFFIKI